MQPFYFTDLDPRDIKLLEILANNIKENNQKLASDAYSFFTENMRDVNQLKEEDFLRQSESLIHVLSEQLQGEDKANRTSQFERPSLLDILHVIPYVKQSIWLFLNKMVMDNELPTDQNMMVVQVIDHFFDQMMNDTEGSLRELEKDSVYYKTLQELEAPLIPVSDDLGILPLIGEVDTYKSQLIMESTTLERAQELDLSTLILDLSGVSHIDTLVAQDIYDFTVALKVLGIEVIIVGFTPDIAQTSVNLNISFKHFSIYSNLAVALQHMGYPS